MDRRSYVAFLAAGLAGCSGSDGGSKTSPQTQTEPQSPSPTQSPTPSPTATATPTATPTQTPSPTPVPTTASVDILLTEAPTGLRKYKLTLSTSGDGTIASVTPELLSGDQFQVTSGGEGNSAVAVRGADLVDGVGTFSEPRVLVTVEFETPVAVPAVSYSVATLVNDEGNQMDYALVDIEYDTTG